jgi:hypothetical protein
MPGSVTLGSDKIFRTKDTVSREVTIACVGDASNGTIPDTNLAVISGLEHGPLTGWGLWMVETIYGATGPTDDSDLYLKTEDGTDVLGGNGVNTIDNAANNLVYPPVSPYIIGTTLTLDVDNQAVLSATYEIKLYLTR